MKKRLSYRPHLESLEARDVPAFSITQSGSVLFLSGSRQAEIVRIDDLGSNDILITQGGTERLYSNINRINVSGKEGNDSVTYSVVSPSVKLWLDVRLGSGDDTFQSSISLLPEEPVLETLNSGKKLPPDNVHRIDVNGDAGNDNITLAAEGFLPAGINLEANLSGGSGRDNIVASLAGANEGTVRLKIDGDSGNDNLAAVLGRSTGPSSTNTGVIDIKVEGGTGDDYIKSWLGRSSGDELAPSEGVINAGTINVTLDGQTGNDSVNYLAGAGNAFSAQIVNTGSLNVNVRGSHGNDSVLAAVGTIVDNGLGEFVNNFYNTGTFRLNTEGNAGRDSVFNYIWLDNSGAGSFRGTSEGGLSKDSLYYELVRAGDNASNAQATLNAGKLDDPVLASAIVQVLNAKKVTIIPEVMI
jgi:hypothetical protein